MYLIFSSMSHLKYLYLASSWINIRAIEVFLCHLIYEKETPCTLTNSRVHCGRNKSSVKTPKSKCWYFSHSGLCWDISRYSNLLLLDASMVPPPLSSYLLSLSHQFTKEMYFIKHIFLMYLHLYCCYRTLIVVHVYVHLHIKACVCSISSICI